MSITHAERMLRLFADVAPPILARNFRVDRCVNATRVTIDALADVGLRAAPLSVHARAYNAPYWEFIVTHNRLPIAEELPTLVGAGAWAVGIDTETPPPASSWAGHLLAVVERCWIVDASAVQFSRPGKALFVPDVFVGPVVRRWAKEPHAAIFEGPSGVRLTYSARPDDTSYRTLPGFQRHESNREVAAALVAALRS